MKPQQYDYLAAGFDSFLSRSIDDTPQINLDSQGPKTTQMSFDRAQVSGSLGNTLRIGNVKLDGINGNITISDQNSNDFLLIGNDV